MNEVKKPLVPVIPRQVAEAIEHIRNNVRNDNYFIVRLAIDDRGETDLRKMLTEYARDNFDTFACAVVNGYEIEKSAEELAHDRIRAHCEVCRGNAFYLYGVRDTLTELGITIEGVNA